MSTITKEFTKEQLIEKLQHRISVAAKYPDLEEAQLDAAIFKIALASLEAEPVCYLTWHQGFRAPDDCEEYVVEAKPGDKSCDGSPAFPVYAAQPAPVSLTEEQRAMLRDMDDDIVAELEEEERICRTSMLQGADKGLQRKAAIHDALCEKYNVESLTDFVDWQRNHIAELEAAPPAPVGPGETAVMPDYAGCALTQRECYQAGKKAGLAEAVNAPVTHDGWVACSERMPENDDFVYIWPRKDFGVELHVAQYGKFDKRDAGWYAQVYEQNYGIEYHPITVTHWMPLPAAPQQEVKS
ncbi:DUF551 domain-containing protein [Enterobacter asburiae]